MKWMGVTLISCPDGAFRKLPPGKGKWVFAPEINMLIISPVTWRDCTYVDLEETVLIKSPASGIEFL